MENSTKVGIAATGALGAAGAGAGYAISKNYLPNYYVKQNMKLVDEYVNNALDATMHQVHQTVDKSKWEETFSKIVKDARKTMKNCLKGEAKYAKFSEEILEKAKASKIKWITGLAAAGVAIGTAATLIYKKVTADKAQKAE